MIYICTFESMKKTLILLLIMTLSFCAFGKEVKVKGYTKKDGTYVAPHTRSSPNSTQRDNYGTKGNYNPSTGKSGTQTPQK